MPYFKRHCESSIKALLKQFPVVLLLGVRQCGKTYLLKNLYPKWKYFDLENLKDRDFLTRDFDFFFQEHPKNIILDEAQEIPEIFKHLRGVIDRNRKQKGRFLITGSSSPELIAKASDSLAGRIAILELGTFKMSEIRKKEISPFFDIFDSSLKPAHLNFLKSMKSKYKHFDVLKLMLKGGYPYPCMSKNKDYFDLWMKNYFDTYVNRDIKKLYPRLDSLRFQRFISMLSELSGTIINRAQAGRSLDLSEVSVKDYLEIADKTYIWRQVPAFSHSQKKSLVKMPKGFLRDSGLIHYLLNIKTKDQLLRSPKVGQIFESFVIEEILKGLSIKYTRYWNYSYYRTKNGAEIDLLIEGDFGLLPIKIKISSFVENRSLIALKQFIAEYSLPFGLVINNSQEIKMVSEKILQIPAGFL